MSLEYNDAHNKAVAVARMYFLGGRQPEPLGPGSKEKSSALHALAEAVGLNPDLGISKSGYAQMIAKVTKVSWDDSCSSTGDTITLEGMNRIVRGAYDLMRRTRSDLPRRFWREFDSIDGEQGKYTPEGKLNMDTRVNELQEEIVEHIIYLSSEGPRPGRMGDTVINRWRGEDLFADGLWRSAISDVQDWLYFHGQLEADDIVGFDLSLRQLLGLDPGETRFDQDADALEALQSRLSIAVAAREIYLEIFSEEEQGDAPKGSAEKVWHTKWEDEEEDEGPASLGPITAQATIMSIPDFVGRARKGRLSLNPSYQRADVWPNSDAQQLIESVIRGIPLPSIILIKRRSDKVDLFEVVDGKQRLTSILRFVGQHPKALEIVAQKAKQWGEPDLVKIFQEDYAKFRRMWKQYEFTSLTQATEREFYFPFKLRKAAASSLKSVNENLPDKYYYQIKEQTIELAGGIEDIETLFEHTSSYKIPVITYDQISDSQVHEVFTLYNRQGKRLNAEEIRNATFHELDLMIAILYLVGDYEGDKPASFDGLDIPVEEVREALSGYNIARAGYKRSKILQWVVAVLLQEDGNLESKSTASAINMFLSRVTGNRTDPFRDTYRISRLIESLAQTVLVHSTVPTEQWHPKFKSHTGNKWMDLQLVGSLIAIFVGVEMRGETLLDKLEERYGELYTATQALERPVNAQSRSQWEYIGQVVRRLLEVLEIDPSVADRHLRKEYGASGLLSLIN